MTDRDKRRERKGGLRRERERGGGKRRERWILKEI